MLIKNIALNCSIWLIFAATLNVQAEVDVSQEQSLKRSTAPLIIVPYGNHLIPIKNPNIKRVLHCLVDPIVDKGLQSLTIPWRNMGRFTVGDVDGDKQADIVVTAVKGKKAIITAYNVCGDVLWEQKNVSANLQFQNHVYVHWSSFGFVGDVYGNGNPAFMHIGQDQKTLFVRDGKTGNIQHKIELQGFLPYRFVLTGKRLEDKEGQKTRIFVTGSPNNKNVQAIDLRSGKAVKEWFFRTDSNNDAYTSPFTADLDEDDADEIVHGLLIVDDNGNKLMSRNFKQQSVLGSAHTCNYGEFNKDMFGREIVCSVYGPKRGQPTLVSYNYT
ncbi:MAG: hypothetical protein OEQ24_09490, partial [Gammaproteobacteria bacterium]|nr:hypothetical protein [Gammaproteobacteria bacterium]